MWSTVGKSGWHQNWRRSQRRAGTVQTSQGQGTLRSTRQRKQRVRKRTDITSNLVLEDNYLNVHGGTNDKTHTLSYKRDQKTRGQEHDESFRFRWLWRHEVHDCDVYDAEDRLWNVKEISETEYGALNSMREVESLAWAGQNFGMMEVWEVWV